MDFIVVGGVGAVLQGAPIMTFELDIVHSTEKTNVARLLVALDSLDAFYRAQPERKTKPDASHLGSSGHQLLMTQYGPLDLLGSIGHGHTHRDLALASLIAIKEETAGEKDQAVLPVLRRTLRERG